MKQFVQHRSKILLSSLSLFLLEAFLQLQQDICWEDVAFQGSRVLQREEQQSMWKLQSGGWGGV